VGFSSVGTASHQGGGREGKQVRAAHRGGGFDGRFGRSPPPILAAATQRPITDIAFSEPATEPAWKTIPSWFVYGDQARHRPALFRLRRHAGLLEPAEVDLILEEAKEAAEDSGGSEDATDELGPVTQTLIYSGAPRTIAALDVGALVSQATEAGAVSPSMFIIISFRIFLR
jgi:hypothetical protein